MNKMINKFFLAGDTFVPIMHFRRLLHFVKPEIPILLADHFLKTKKSYKI